LTVSPNFDATARAEDGDGKRRFQRIFAVIKKQSLVDRIAPPRRAQFRRAEKTTSVISPSKFVRFVASPSALDETPRRSSVNYFVARNAAARQLLDFIFRIAAAPKLPPYITASRVLCLYRKVIARRCVIACCRASVKVAAT
jgi:hypothetical protein